MALTGTPFATGFNYQLTQETVLGIAGQDNVRYGPTTLFHVESTVATAAATEVQLKLHDDNNPAFGTALPVMGFPSGLDGKLALLIPGGFPFVNGLSMCACEEFGTSVTNPPDTN